MVGGEMFSEYRRSLYIDAFNHGFRAYKHMRDLPAFSDIHEDYKTKAVIGWYAALAEDARRYRSPFIAPPHCGPAGYNPNEFDSYNKD